MTAFERLEGLFARIAAENDEARIFISLDRAGAAAAAEAADRRREAGASLGALDGALVGVKDNIAVAGLPWTAGIGAYRGRIAQEDAGVVARLRAAGAVLVGTLNMHEGALGATSDNPHFGRCVNPPRPGCTPGGSSGGSAAAVAGGYLDMAVGSDTMGSVRIPAAYCGVAGLKPTDGLVGRAGLSYLSPSLDCIGPIAPSVADLGPALIAMAGADADPQSLGTPAERRDDLRLVGIPAQLASVDCEPAVHERFERARRALGAEAVEVSLDGWDPGATRRAGLLLAEAEGAVAMSDLLDPGVAGVSEDFRSLLAYGARAPSSRLVSALARIAAARAACERAFRAVDLLLLPSAPQQAFAHGTPAPANQADFTALANFARCPAVSLPSGVQLIGPPWRDLDLLAVAARLEQALSP